MEAPLGDDVMGEDPTVNLLQETAAAMLGLEAALFAPSGTQTNLVAMMTHCQRGEEAVVGQQWHTNRWEAGGMAVLGSTQPPPIEHFLAFPDVPQSPSRRLVLDGPRDTDGT